jgi:hypothetical protein
MGGAHHQTGSSRGYAARSDLSLARPQGHGGKSDGSSQYWSLTFLVGF